MNILLLGGGGREHALGWAIAKSPALTRLWACPGNPGLATVADLLPAEVMAAEAKLLTFAHEAKIDLVVIGPEAPLVAGLADVLRRAGIATLGPSQAAAQLEGSKSFARTFADRHRIPQPAWRRFSDSKAACDYIASNPAAKYVIKADGLAAGKGVVIAENHSDARQAIIAMLDDGQFGQAGKTILIEECLTGVEASLFVLTDGSHAIPFGSAQDYKRAHDGDAGPNTGGMGAISPAPALTEELEKAAWQDVILPCIAGMADESTPYNGFLYAGLMVTNSGVKLIEFNCRFGDPEAQAILPRLESDLLPLLAQAAHVAGSGKFASTQARLANTTSSVAVVMANAGYPTKPKTGGIIQGLDKDMDSSFVFHSGTTGDSDSDAIRATGGRVLTITGLGATPSQARAAAYHRVKSIHWDGCFYRRDIGTN